MTARTCLLMTLLLAAAPLCAQAGMPADKPRAWQSSFGQNVLANCDLIAYGIAAAQRGMVDGALSVEVTVQEIVYGEEKSTTITIVFNDASVLPGGEAAEAIFAVKRMAGSGYALVGKPELVKGGDSERDIKLAVARDFIALEKEPEGDQRDKDFLALLERHLADSSYAAENAALELREWVQRRPEKVDRELFDRFEKVSKDFSNAPKVMADLLWALAFMVEKRVKSEEFKVVRRGKKADEKTKAIQSLARLVKTYGGAFTESDAKLCDALQKAEGLTSDQAQSLADLATAIRLKVEWAENRRKEALKPKVETREVPREGDPGKPPPKPVER